VEIALLEAALALSEQPDTIVHIYPIVAKLFGRVKGKNRERLAQAEASNQITVELKSNVKEIRLESVVMELADKEIVEIPNIAVIICAGGVLPTPFLKDIGVMVENSLR